MNCPAEKERISKRMRACKTRQQLVDVCDQERDAFNAVARADKALGKQLANLKAYLMPTLLDDPARQAGPV